MSRTHPAILFWLQCQRITLLCCNTFNTLHTCEIRTYFGLTIKNVGSCMQGFTESEIRKIKGIINSKTVQEDQYGQYKKYSIFEGLKMPANSVARNFKISRNLKNIAILKIMTITKMPYLRFLGKYVDFPKIKSVALIKSKSNDKDCFTLIALLCSFQKIILQVNT